MTIKARIIEILKEHQGRSNPIKASQIAALLGINEEGGLTNPRTRCTIREIIDSTDIPVGSCPKGYFIITSQSEYEQVWKGLKSREDSIRSRRFKLEENYRTALNRRSR